MHVQLMSAVDRFKLDMSFQFQIALPSTGFYAQCMFAAASDGRLELNQNCKFSWETVELSFH